MPGSAQQNGKAEWFNHTIMDKALAMQHTAGLFMAFGNLQLNLQVHIYNRTPTRVLKWRTPYAVWNNGTIPDITYLPCIWLQSLHACTADKCRKLDEKSLCDCACWVEPGSKGYKLWDRQNPLCQLSRM